MARLTPNMVAFNAAVDAANHHKALVTDSANEYNSAAKAAMTLFNDGSHPQLAVIPVRFLTDSQKRKVIR